MRVCFVLGWLVACGGKDGGGFPPAASTAGTDDAGSGGGDEGGGGDGDGDGGGGGDLDCGGEWAMTDEIAIQKGTCLVWSTLSNEEMTWFEAASESDGELGGCSSYCPDEAEAYCATLDGTDGRNDWRLPSKEEIEDAANSRPPMEDTDTWIWSRDTDPNAPELAWKGNLGQPGASWGAGKEAARVFVRCVSDP